MDTLTARQAQILKLMKPPLEVPKDAERSERVYELKVAGLPGESDIRYIVQVPLEYDPLRHYPTIVTLADAGVAPEQMIDAPLQAEQAVHRRRVSRIQAAKSTAARLSVTLTLRQGRWTSTNTKRLAVPLRLYSQS